MQKFPEQIQRRVMFWMQLEQYCTVSNSGNLFSEKIAGRLFVLTAITFQDLPMLL